VAPHETLAQKEGERLVVLRPLPGLRELRGEGGRVLHEVGLFLDQVLEDTAEDLAVERGGGHDQLVDAERLGGPTGDHRATPPGRVRGCRALRPRSMLLPAPAGHEQRCEEDRKEEANWPVHECGSHGTTGRAPDGPGVILSEMKLIASLGLSRRLLIASAVFGLFVLFDIALFGWLIFRSLSQREIERVLLETREEAETLAQRIAERAGRQGDLYTAVAAERETQTYIDSILRQRDIVRQVEIRDKNGVLVLKSVNQASVQTPGPDGPAIVPGTPELPGLPKEDKRSAEWTATYEVPDVQVPIGDLGLLQTGISAPELAKRIEILRRELIQQAAVIGGLSIFLLLTAYAGVWLLMRRAKALEVQAAEAE